MAIHFYTPEFYAFNNFSAHVIEFDGVVYPTAEHAYQAMKCTSSEGKKAIQTAKSPLLAKEAANVTHKASKDPDWDEKKVAVMETILRAKLAQHNEVAELLRKSGDKEIAENSPVDYFWGTGADGTGQNVLGKLWMKIRAELQANPSADTRTPRGVDWRI